MVHTGSTTATDTAPPLSGDGLRRLSDALWAERELLERLLFKLDEERLLLEAGRRWVWRGRDEIDHVLAAIDKAAVERRERLCAVAASLGVGPDLGAVVEAAPYPWDTILNEHRRAVAGSVREILAVAADNRLARDGLDSIRGRVDWAVPFVDAA